MYDNVTTYGRFTTDLQQNVIYKKNCTRKLQETYNKIMTKCMTAH